ncbi:MAG: TatD family hydrolase [Rikenellaceae bacterium]|nr:TatD family hydrolase [Rikenellaceae bacterium]
MIPPYIDIHTHHPHRQPGVLELYSYRLGSREPLLAGKYTAGIHPWDAAAADVSELTFFDHPHHGLIGIGEIGLDFARKETDRKKQTDLLRLQLAVAEKGRLPVLVHCVKAYNQITAESKHYCLPAVIFHGFTGSPTLMEQLVGSGWNLSFGYRMFDSPKTMQALKEIPADRFFLETDDGEKPEIGQLYQRTAELRMVSQESLKQQIFTNYNRIFHG